MWGWNRSVVSADAKELMAIMHTNNPYLMIPSPACGRRWREATDEGFSDQYVPSDDTLIRPLGTFSQREKGADTPSRGRQTI